MFATSGQARLAYSSVGAGDPVLLIHPGVTDRRGWHHLSDQLTPNHQVISYDQRGYGETTYQPESYSGIADALAVLDTAGAGQAAVVGCSLGGETAIDLALEHPDRVSRLVLIAPAVSGDAPWLESYPEPISTLMQKLKAAEEAGDIAAVNRLEAWLWLDGPTAAEGRVGGEARELFLTMNGIALANQNPGEPILAEPAWDRLDRIAIPTLILCGELDLPDQLPVCHGIAERIPDAQLPHLENDQTCLAAITDLLH